ncbi:MAG: DUF805 domain-containing protein [Planctomycetota bacterium]|nr:DUF805 domain-containing protein [Planctomycetota bacterium]
MNVSLADLWSWHGRLGRARYVTLGVLLGALQYVINNAIAEVYFWRAWPLLAFVLPEPASYCTELDRDLNTAILFVALPFVWAGLVLTVRRLRDALWPAWLALFFFVPLLNVLLFGALALAPSRRAEDLRCGDAFYLWRGLAELAIPRGAVPCALGSIALTAALAMLALALGVHQKFQLGWGFFAGIPFWMGFFAVLLHGYDARRGRFACAGLGALTVGIAAFALVGLGLEGLAPMARTLLLAAPLGAMGGLLGYAFQARFERSVEDAPRGTRRVEQTAG